MNKHTSEMNNLNNFKQPEALHLVDYLEFSHRHAEHSPKFIAAAELRRLYAENERLWKEREELSSENIRLQNLVKDLSDWNDKLKKRLRFRFPLTDEQMWKIWNEQGDDAMEQKAAIAFARAVEESHGIYKEEN